MKDWFWILVGAGVVYWMYRSRPLSAMTAPTTPVATAPGSSAQAYAPKPGPEADSDPGVDDIPSVDGYGKFHHDIHSRYVPDHRYDDPHSPVARIGYWPPTGRYSGGMGWGAGRGSGI